MTTECPWADHFLMEQDEELINAIKAKAPAYHSRYASWDSDDTSLSGDAASIALVDAICR